ncbi:hypothetical protein PTNB73_04757 [Pyrenophora teres f. teres]|uniref:Aflatoxin regulatory protein domain-containing protein n=1 Tax=Pyrenophora teres f. teres (strain 0-1) TaxID=861557 RepID=E3RJG7_PYRTT|nr:hypothetical protein PTT_08291 [Pyrenophora teres f. teres 0-1]KAE8866663.1 hypothetical protein PTNB73_04757 [Pyrenophora teres f. teres]
MSHDNSASPSSPQTACLETNALDCYFMGNTPEQDAVMFLENETATAHFSIDTIGTFPSEHSATNLEPRAYHDFCDPTLICWEELIHPNTSLLPDSRRTTGSSGSPNALTPSDGTGSISKSLTAPPSERRNCDCFTKAMEVHESMIETIWGQKHLLLDMNDILHQQKRALSHCEQVLQCPNCRRKTAFLTTIMTICSKIIRSIHWTIKPNESTTSTRNADEINSHASTTATQDFHLRVPFPTRFGDTQHESEPQLVVASCLSFKPSVIPWHKLDDDDEAIVMRSLLQARLKRLHRLLEELEKAVSDQGHPAHVALLTFIKSRISHDMEILA